MLKYFRRIVGEHVFLIDLSALSTENEYLFKDNCYNGLRLMQAFFFIFLLAFLF